VAKQPVFHLKNITYRYPGGQLGLKGINLTIYAGERVVVLGANGSGKSTLLKLLDGLIFASEGEFFAFGQPVNEALLETGEFATSFRQRVAFVFQDSDVQLFSPTVYEEITFGPRQLDLPKAEIEQRANDLLQMLGLTNLKERQPHQLSGGQKKKVAIASSLAVNPDILLLDEPTNNLDPRTQVWLFNLLMELNASGKTVILATQDLDLAQKFAERLVIVSEEHTVAADSYEVEKLLANKELLLNVNLIHEHFLAGQKVLHQHPGGEKKHTH